MYHIYILSSRMKICPRFPTFSTKESFVGNLPSLIKLVTRRLAVLIYLAGEWIQIEMIGISVCNDVSLGDKNVLITWHADSAEVETQVNAVIHMHFDCIRQTSGTNSTSWLRCHKPPYLLPLSLSLSLSLSRLLVYRFTGEWTIRYRFRTYVDFVWSWTYYRCGAYRVGKKKKREEKYYKYFKRNASRLK